MWASALTKPPTMPPATALDIRPQQWLVHSLLALRRPPDWADAAGHDLALGHPPRFLHQWDGDASVSRFCQGLREDLRRLPHILHIRAEHSSRQLFRREGQPVSTSLLAQGALGDKYLPTRLQPKRCLVRLTEARVVLQYGLSAASQCHYRYHGLLLMSLCYCLMPRREKMSKVGVEDELGRQKRRQEKGDHDHEQLSAGWLVRAGRAVIYLHCPLGRFLIRHWKECSVAILR